MSAVLNELKSAGETLAVTIDGLISAHERLVRDHSAAAGNVNEALCTVLEAAEAIGRAEIEACATVAHHAIETLRSKSAMSRHSPRRGPQLSLNLRAHRFAQPAGVRARLAALKQRILANQAAAAAGESARMCTKATATTRGEP